MKLCRLEEPRYSFVFYLVSGGESTLGKYMEKDNLFSLLFYREVRAMEILIAVIAGCLS